MTSSEIKEKGQMDVSRFYWDPDTIDNGAFGCGVMHREKPKSLSCEMVEAHHFDRVTAELAALQSRLNETDAENDRLREASLKVIKMNRQHAEDQYGDSNKAESWSCVTTLRNALENKHEQQ